jgi:hypothetical protein
LDAFYGDDSAVCSSLLSGHIVLAIACTCMIKCITKLILVTKHVHLKAIHGFKTYCYILMYGINVIAILKVHFKSKSL